MVKQRTSWPEPWEDHYFVEGLLNQKRLVTYGGVRLPYDGPLKHWPEFRDYLLHRMDGEAFDFDRFEGSDAQRKAMGYPWRIARSLARWTQGSRRIFTITEELQDLLEGMTLGAVGWNEIVLPFDAFILALPRPILALAEDMSPQEAFDLIFVEKVVDPDRDGFRMEFGCVSPNILQYRPLGETVRKDWLKAVEKVRRNRLERMMDLQRASMKKEALFWRHEIEHDILEQSRLGDIDEAFGDESLPTGPYSAAWREFRPNLEILRYVGAFSLYLMSLPPQSGHRSNWQPADPSPDPKAITRGTEVCSVSSVFTLTTEEREAFRWSPSGRRQQAAHFRRGHFRKRPGQGSDPDAPKVVLVRPALVRGDRLKPGELPGGSLANLKPLGGITEVLKTSAFSFPRIENDDLFSKNFQQQNNRFLRSSWLAGAVGIEPTLAVLETAVLPLYETPMRARSYRLAVVPASSGPKNKKTPPLGDEAAYGWFLAIYRSMSRRHNGQNGSSDRSAASWSRSHSGRSSFWAMTQGRVQWAPNQSRRSSPRRLSGAPNKWPNSCTTVVRKIPSRSRRRGSVRYR